MPVIKAVMRKYRSVREEKDKKVVFISFTEPVTELNFMKCCSSMKGLLKSPSDTYLFQFADSGVLSAYMIKLLFRFKNSTDKKIGIVLDSGIRQKISILRLDEYFTLGDSERSVLMHLESSV